LPHDSNLYHPSIALLSPARNIWRKNRHRMKIEVGPVSQSFLDIFRNKVCSDRGTLQDVAAAPDDALLRTEDIAYHRGIPS
jgi:hypothetical protein